MASLAMLAMRLMRDGLAKPAHYTKKYKVNTILQLSVNINSAWLLDCHACFQSHICWVGLHGWGWYIICSILWGISKRFALIQAFLHLPPSQPPAHDEGKAHTSH